jgi:hypothetical protein
MTQEWRAHPKLKGRFHPQAPDDLQVIAHDGGPRITDHSPELVWVTVTEMDENDVFSGRVINQPKQLSTVSEGSIIRFMIPSGDNLLMVTEKYLRERPQWIIQSFCRCGLDELFDAPSDLLRAVFPDLPDGYSDLSFTARCGVCGGAQVVESKNAPVEEGEPTREASVGARKAKKWWQFWK